MRLLSRNLRLATGLAFATAVLADDPIVIRAMQASTIIEVFIEKRSVRVEMEIGIADLGAFQNLLVDEVRQTLGFEPEPMEPRLQQFFREDFVLRVEGGAPEPGTVVQITSRKRIQRDAITGAELANQPDDAETVLFVVLEFEVEGHPSYLSLQPPMVPDGNGPIANVGFMTYHRGLPVNDFRYLSGEEVLDLDWQDPWFSRFRNPNLRRQFDAPISAFLYLDHFEVRQEVVLRPVDLKQWLDLGLQGRDLIAVSEQEALKQKVVEFLLQRNPVFVDGVQLEPRLDRIHFLRRTLRQTGIIDPPEDLPVHSAMLGVIFYYPIEGLPEHAEMHWDLFSDRFPNVPSAACDEAGGLQQTLTADQPVLRWNNFLVNPQLPGSLRILPRPVAAGPHLPLITTICAGLLLWILLRARRDLRADRAIGNWVRTSAIAALVAGVAFLPYARISLGSPSIPEAEARLVLGGLLHNVYKAFDLRDEGRIYDALERSVSGELLAEVYLETQRGLELENQGGARARVKEVKLLETETGNLRSSAGGELEMDVRGTWIVSGAVGHWGHLHYRRNQYDARFTIRFADGAWRITALELLEELRITQP